MTDTMIATTIACSTPTTMTSRPVMAAMRNSLGRTLRIARRPVMSTSSMPIRKTTEASTAEGMTAAAW